MSESVSGTAAAVSRLSRDPRCRGVRQEVRQGFHRNLVATTARPSPPASTPGPRLAAIAGIESVLKNAPAPPSSTVTKSADQEDPGESHQEEFGQGEHLALAKRPRAQYQPVERCSSSQLTTRRHCS